MTTRAILRPPAQGKQEISTLHLPISKSLMARRMLLCALLSTPESIESKDEYPEDIQAIYSALEEAHKGSSNISVRESGTAMRLMAAYLCATTTIPIRLEGTGRQHQRPIAPLVSALRELGAKITYLQQEGYPPLYIEPSSLKARSLELDVSASSQYLSALLLIAPKVWGDNYVIDTRRSGLTSAPYALMTVNVMREYGHSWLVNDGVFAYQGYSTESKVQTMHEADWSAASYAYLQVALKACQSIHLPNLLFPSLQGDSLYLPKIFDTLGIVTTQTNDGILIRQGEIRSASLLHQDCTECPDLVPTFVGACIALSIPFKFSGVGHLRIKESDRLQALQNECRKLGAHLLTDKQTISWDGTFIPPKNDKPIALDPHGDHRMAMALAPVFAHKLGEVVVLTPEVVSKSFPLYWQNLIGIGYSICARSESSISPTP